MSFLFMEWIGIRKIKCNSPVDCCLPTARRRQHINFCPMGKNANESHYPPHSGGNSKGRPDRREGKKVSGGHFLGRGRIPAPLTAPRKGVEHAFPDTLLGVFFIFTRMPSFTATLKIHLIFLFFPYISLFSVALFDLNWYTYPGVIQTKRKKRKNKWKKRNST